MIVMIEAPVVEEILVKRLKSWFRSLKWDEIYPNFPIRIGNEYPWVPYINELTGDVDLPDKDDQTALFPSITVVTESDQKSPMDSNVTSQEGIMDSEEYSQLKTDISQNPDKYMISPEAITEIDAFFSGGGTGVSFVAIPFRKRDNVQFEIVTDDQSDIKNRIYDALVAFLTGPGKISLFKELSINILEHTVSGSRSGEYNVEFGRVLHGCLISFQADYVVETSYLYTDGVVVENIEIDHGVN